MTRNTENRVEVASPIEDEFSKHEIIKYLHTQMNDNVNSRVLDGTKRYKKVKPKGKIIDSQAPHVPRN